MLLLTLVLCGEPLAEGEVDWTKAKWVKKRWTKVIVPLYSYPLNHIPCWLVWTTLVHVNVAGVHVRGCKTFLSLLMCAGESGGHCPCGE